MDTGLNFSRILKYESFIASWLLLIGGLAVVLRLYKFGLNPYVQGDIGATRQRSADI